jgi:putative OPT family oligopeptide transporter
VGVTMPAIMILGFDLEVTRVMLVAVLGGLLGILMMIPLRRPLIVDQHGIIKYPEGTACAEVLKAGDSAKEGQGAGTIFAGFAIGVIYKIAMVALKAWKDVPERVFGPPLAAGSISAEISPELLGVGYIIGPGTASVMCGGGVLAYLVLIPAIKFFGSGIPGVLPPGSFPIREMTPSQIRGAYILYIGAGAVAAGGIISLARSLPTIWQGLRAGIRDFARARGPAAEDVPRTDQDLPIRFVLFGTLGLIVAIVLATPLRMNLGGALLIVIFGFLFVTVSSRLTGEIGSSSNPISGMTVATLLLTCAVFLFLGWTGPTYYVTALSVGGIVCIAAANAGTTSQDLKTGFLIGATPRHQQIAILVGALVSAIALGPILLKLNDAATVYVPQTTETGGTPGANLHTDVSKLTVREKLSGPQGRTDPGTYWVWNKTDDDGGPAGRYFVNDAGNAVYLVDPGINGTHATRPDGSRVVKFDAPKATLMSYIIKGILNRRLPWELVLLGVGLAIVLEMSGIPSLAFAVGVYLPLSASTPIFAGGCVRWLVDRYVAKKHAGEGLTSAELSAEADKSPGILMASGYIAGGAIAGVVVAFLAGTLSRAMDAVDAWSTLHNPLYEGPYSDLLSLLPFATITALLYAAGLERFGSTEVSRTSR